MAWRPTGSSAARPSSGSSQPPPAPPPRPPTPRRNRAGSSASRRLRMAEPRAPSHSRSGPRPPVWRARAGPERAPDVPPELLVLVAGLSVLVLGALWWKRRDRLETSVNFGLACAALLGVFGGSVRRPARSSRARPHPAMPTVRVRRAACSSPGLSTRPRGGARRAPRREPPPRRSEPRPRQRAEATPAATPPPEPASAPAPQPSVSPPRRRRPRPGDAAEAHRLRGEAGRLPVRHRQDKLARGSSASSVARAVEKLTDLNISTRIRSGDPDVLEAGEELKLR